MQLHQLRSPEGSRRRKKYRGRGAASGLGKTSGRGDKGQRSRSGRGILIGLEGGQIPLIRRIPKVGFHTLNPVVYQVVHVEDLNRFEANAKVDIVALKAKQMVSSLRKPVKILGDGELKKSLTVVADKFTASAAAKITKAGGKAEVISKEQEKPVTSDKKAKN
ncbi:MAG: 50S ribosomal protein L15 [Candidatus Omnitrophica bacterium]|nr:50S ribosomal protein L15 [Candidatus Omnitrophota bacterium]